MELILIWKPRIRTALSFIITSLLGLFFILNILQISDIFEIIGGLIVWVLAIGIIPNIIALIYSGINRWYNERLFVSLIYIFLIIIPVTFIVILILSVDLAGYDFTLHH